jgi:hypothetical protein
MSRENATILQAEFAHLAEALSKLQFGTLTLQIVVHKGEISRVVRGTELSVRTAAEQSGGRG